jgi:hypothetical protein
MDSNGQGWTAEWTMDNGRWTRDSNASVFCSTGFMGMGCEVRWERVQGALV